MQSCEINYDTCLKTVRVTIQYDDFISTHNKGNNNGINKLSIFHCLLQQYCLQIGYSMNLKGKQTCKKSTKLVTTQP